MKMRHLSGVITILFLLSMVIGGCAKSELARPPAGTGMVFQKPLPETYDAARESLVKLGFQIVKQEAGYIEGAYPRSICRKGDAQGEHVGIWIDSRDRYSARVLIDTLKTPKKIKEQKEWRQDVLRKMMEILR